METLVIKAPIFGVQTTQPCWKCSTEQSLLAVGSIFCEDPTREEALQLSPNYRKAESLTAGCSYYMNICDACGAHTGDHFLFSEPGQGFWPTTQADYDRIVIKQLPLDGEYHFRAQAPWSGHAHVWDNCKVLSVEGQPDDALQKDVRSCHRASLAAAVARLTKQKTRRRKPASQ